MRQSDPLELEGAEAQQPGLPDIDMAADKRNLASSAAQLAQNLAWMPGEVEERPLCDRCQALSGALRPILKASKAPLTGAVSEDLSLLRRSTLLIESELEDACRAFRQSHRVPQVRTPDGAVIPRITALAEGYLAAVHDEFSPGTFAEYVEAFQEVTVLKMSELWAVIPVLKLVLLEQVARCGQSLRTDGGSGTIEALVASLREIKLTSWKNVIEPLIRFDRILRDDPAAAYSRMDDESRDLYRNRVVSMAEHSDYTEMQIAQEALALAHDAQKHPDADPRVTSRDSHVGTYLVAEGTPLLEERVDFHAPIGHRLRAFLRRHPDEFYLPGIAVLTLAIVLGVVLLLTNPSTPLGLVLFSALAVLPPGSQSAVQIMNYVATALLPAQILPKLDFSEGLPADCATLVAIPTLLLDEQQVHRLVDDLEVRFLGNHDPNLHFMLLTDLPDSAAEPKGGSVLVDLCSNLIRALNEKYQDQEMGSFFLLHRNPVYNPRERLWMGWERKRGKLMDLNNLLRGQFDSFPVKVGNLSILSTIRFVITLDSDTELPRGSARRMVGALAHPLNQAIIDPERGVVVAGYGILQPRVGVSVQSSVSSRLASIYSGQTGLDIYTRAASDVYQDLYGDGIFVGKGIYEVEALHRVLDRRFPSNALLSHDLVEGAYARAGLVSDIEIIEDYPSHYSAHNRRKHRWLRGDWQIAEWLRPLVPEESGHKVPNPLSVVSRWKILDNLRRSLVEPALFVLLLLGWLMLPGGARAWTLATVIILFLPALFQLGFEFINATARGRRTAFADSFNSFLNAAIANCLTVTFLAHQALLSLDAMVRTLVRRAITRQRLLEWETAAQAELAGYKRTILDIYLSWTPALALGIFFLLWFVHRQAILPALPILVLWAFSKPVSVWLDRPPGAPREPGSEKDQWLLRIASLRTWRYFAEFSTEEHNWLIPDNLQEEQAKVAPRVSPTNVGLLLNARQVACEFGYLTVPEFVQQTLRTLETVSKLQRDRGHLLNWYDTRTLAPLPPAFISSVDCGNLVASLWTLQQGCLDLLERPLLPSVLQEGFLDHLHLLVTVGALPRRRFSRIKSEIKQQVGTHYLLDVSEAVLKDLRSAGASPGRDAHWFQEQAEERIRQVCKVGQLYAPWLLPEFAALKDDPALRISAAVTIEQIPKFIDGLVIRLKAAVDSPSTETTTETRTDEKSEHCLQLLSLLPDARSHALRLVEEIKNIAGRAAQLADEMDFTFLLNRKRGLLSVGFDVEKQQLHGSCYDLLASESRIALFIAIAKDDIPQESWFQLGRSHALDQGMPVLLSWTGTMFEYLMPALWMRIYPNTLLERAGIAAVRSQQAYAADLGIPWGISESAYFKQDECGNYQYHAFGVPPLAIRKADDEGPVVSAYSTFLALAVDSQAALRNLHHLQHKKLLARYGFYEALDFNPKRCRSRIRRFELVRCWMAHHQGMSLLAMANFMRNDVVQRWFHSHPRVQATELLLQEKPATQFLIRSSRTPA